MFGWLVTPAQTDAARVVSLAPTPQQAADQLTRARAEHTARCDTIASEMRDTIITTRAARETAPAYVEALERFRAEVVGPDDFLRVASRPHLTPAERAVLIDHGNELFEASGAGRSRPGEPHAWAGRTRAWQQLRQSMIASDPAAQQIEAATGALARLPRVAAVASMALDNAAHAIGAAPAAPLAGRGEDPATIRASLRARGCA